MFENVDERTDGQTTDGQRKDARVIGNFLLITHLETLDSCELPN